MSFKRKINRNSITSKIEFICDSCKIKELIPRDVVEMLDATDQAGDVHYPPTFYCKNCDGVMFPTYYKSINGIVHEYTN